MTWHPCSPALILFTPPLLEERARRRGNPTVSGIATLHIRLVLLLYHWRLTRTIDWIDIYKAALREKGIMMLSRLRKPFFSPLPSLSLCSNLPLGLRLPTCFCCYMLLALVPHFRPERCMASCRTMCVDQKIRRCLLDPVQVRSRLLFVSFFSLEIMTISWKTWSFFSVSSLSL